MTSRWLVTPFYFEHPEPALFSAAPEGAAKNAPTGITDRAPASMARLHQPIAEFVEQTLHSGARPISLVGDCCAAIPVLAGLRTAGVEPTLVWIDAHGDFNTPETSPSQFLGGMPLAMMVGRGPQWMCEAVGLAPLPEELVWLIDGRDLDPLEREALDASRVNRAGVAGLAALEFAGPLHVHIDLDVIDAAEAPGFNYPVPGGPGAAETADACAQLAARTDIRAISISGWTEALDPGGTTGAACRRVLRALTGEGPGDRRGA
jgi:arginase